MQQIKLKNKKHLVLIKVPSDMSKDVMDKVSDQIKQAIPELNLMLFQAETEINVITIED